MPDVTYGHRHLIDDDTVRIGDPPKAIFTFAVTGDQLRLTPTVPSDCTTPACIETSTREKVAGIADLIGLLGR